MSATPLDHAAEIAALLAATDIEILELTGPAGHLWLRRDGQSSVTPDEPVSNKGGDATAAKPTHDVVPSPGFGLFLHAHPLHEAPLVRVGARVAAGQVLGFLRIGALLDPVRAPRAGVVSTVLAPDGSLVGYGDPLFELSPPP